MTRAFPSFVVPRPRAARAVIVGRVLAACAAAPLEAFAATEGPGAGTPVETLVALGVAATLFVWGLRAQRRANAQTAALQQSRAEHQALRTALDVWQWRTDAEHRIVEWRAPMVPHGPGPAVRTGARLWDTMAVVDTAGASLQARLEQRAPVPGIRTVLAAGPQARTATLMLHAQPVLDAEGRFVGYVGTARPVLDSAGSLLADVLLALPLPVLRVTLPTRGRPSRLLQHNPAAAAWVPETEAPTWNQVLHALPDGVRPVLEQALLQPDDVLIEAPGGWALRLHRLPCVPPSAMDEEVLVVFQHTQHFAARPVETSTSAEDAESFSYTVSHDLRAPLRVVDGFTKIVKEDYAHVLDRVGNDHLDRVLAAAARMNSMIDALLALSQLSSRPLSRQPVNLSMLAGYIVDDLRRQSPERTVEVQIAPELQAHGDATLLRVVLENLIGNAWKYTGKCRVGRIWIEGSEHEGRPAITVRDNGAGFDMRFADRLFGVFQRLHSANDFQGTGIGLASVRRILRRHGGDIWAEAEVDRGARFQFWV